MSRAPVRRRTAALLATLAVVVAQVVTVVAGPLAAPATAADLSKFDPGFIISDPIFYDSGAMSGADVQAFLNQKGASCVPGSDGTPCLKNFRQATTSRPADAKCPGAYVGVPEETAASIIVKVAAACGINPRVLIVMLQKEQGLVTGSGSGLYANRYRSAMGYGCPDTAACDAQYYGFFNQVYSAAAQFKNYANNPTRYGHRAGLTNNVRFHPNAACGSSAVYIQNQATASLYNYTPYQPNAAALAAGYSTGDACSSYGNRNFWNYFRDWFGPTTDRLPVGSFDSVTSDASSITATGWALDPDTNNPIAVHVYVGSAGTAFTADQSRPDVGAAYKKGDLHGFSAKVPTAPGTYNVCVYAINDWAPGGNTLIACRSITVVNRVPFGNIESVTAAPGSITATGWALDPDTNDPIAVHMYVDSASAAFTANGSRPDVGRVWGRGDLHGLTATMNATSGPHTVCFYAINATPGANAQIGCRTVTVPAVVTPPEANRPPMGNLETATVGEGTVSVSGWALDPDTDDPVTVQLSVDGAVVSSFVAKASRPDVGRVWGRGDLHGFAATVNTTSGSHEVCVTALNATTGPSTQIACRTLVVPAVQTPPASNRVPFGNIETVTAAAGSITVTGWALDPDTNDPITVHMYVDSASAAFTANGSRPDVGQVWGRGDLHGFNATMSATTGAHTVCIYGINATPGANAQIGCRTVTVP
ncbi:hypothetical protein [Cellulomonas sp. Root137]|uniref:hypothetical protein n=1 Tax=Cellulomonas sp. Root137 TaxID=1736459 RepID=UPI0006FB62C5|nr:hypothetical protein [Cellulomonas sp. Root137]KQY47505.1 hypothetical protein ASD18_09330 [Cellulomonas sp. Root137]